MGDEGGYAPAIKTTRDALDAISEAIDKAGYKGKVKLGMDSAASEFYKDGKYQIDGKSLTTDKLVSYYLDILKDYPIVSLEDPFAEDDWNGYVSPDEEGGKVTVIGDDLFVTNVKRLKKGIDMGAGNALLLKLNQIGSSIRGLRRGGDGVPEQVQGRRQPPVGRDQRQHHRGRIRCARRRVHQDRCAGPERADVQVQPAAPDRGEPGQRGEVYEDCNHKKAGQAFAHACGRLPGFRQIFTRWRGSSSARVWP